MNKEKVSAAMSEARRFLRKADDFMKANQEFYTPKESGALRRASMDLTRSLSEMRKPGA